MIDNLLVAKHSLTKPIRLAPKLKVLLFVLIALATVLSSASVTLAGLCLYAGYFWRCSGLRFGYSFKRLMAMDVIVVFTVLLIPFSVQGEVLFTIAGFAVSVAGCEMALIIIIKANIVMLAVMSLTAGMDSTVFSQALHDLGLPRRFSILMQFTVRYIGVLHHEFTRLRQAMLVRGFKPCNSLHTWRSYGYLLGMLVVRSFDRAERILQAMKCRGFNGQFLIKQKSNINRQQRLVFSGYLLVLAVITAYPLLTAL
ncbi:energy-coupling factor transporter transmembrane component T family protein [Shewanella intestini]|uniref:Cobalt ECF transporter T component CbiQ n=1 Tax=Shewanella intestini TaxID=2017544 RepID=A0ABS5HYK8_9GAMM|nr:MULTISPECIES: energy-coupling factor transporter transmembrane component T [Shewanella]MBR9726868.1 cobalt ECF transporter T component CbiQ [Shewanella intestini]MRG34566.1 cobalt ECF transporter T component CbiQ [Shewanella sp. XMDDZSB0408]